MLALRTLLFVVIVASRLAAQAYVTTMPLPSGALCDVKVVGVANGVNTGFVQLYGEDGTLRMTTPVVLSDGKVVRTSVWSGEVASVVVESFGQARAQAVCKEVGSAPAPAYLRVLGFTTVPVINSYALQADDVGTTGFSLSFLPGFVNAPVVHYAGAPASGLVGIATEQQDRTDRTTIVLSRHGTERGTLNSVLGSAVVATARTGSISLVAPTTASISGYEVFRSASTVFALPPGHDDYEHILPHHFASDPFWQNSVSVKASQATIVYFTAKGQGKTIDVQRRVLAAGERFTVQPSDLFATTDGAWLGAA